MTFDETAPQAVRLAVLLMVSHYYENRDNPDKQVYILLQPLRPLLSQRAAP